MQAVQYLQCCSGNGKNYQTPIPTDLRSALWYTPRRPGNECGVRDCGLWLSSVWDKRYQNRPDFGSIQFVFCPISQANLPPPNSTSLWSSSCILYQRFRVQFSDKGLSSIDMGNPAGSVCVCMRELTLPRRRIAAALIYISCGSCGLLKSKPREGESLHPIENPAASSPLLFSLLSSRLISEYLISIMSDPSLTEQGGSIYNLNIG